MKLDLVLVMANSLRPSVRKQFNCANKAALTNINKIIGQISHQGLKITKSALSH